MADNLLQFTSLWIKRSRNRGEPENHTQGVSSSPEYDFDEKLLYFKPEPNAIMVGDFWGEN